MEWIVFNKQTINQYIQFIDNHNNSSIWQYPCWLDFQLQTNKAKDGFFFGIKINNEIKLAGLLLIHQNAMKFNYSYIPGGFLYNDIDKKVYDFFIFNLKKIAKDKKIIYSQIDSITPYSELYYEIINKYKHHKFNIELPIPDHTNIIELSQNENIILSQMKHKGRYNIKLSIKKGVKIKKAKPDEINLFFQLLEKTAIRDNFYINDEEYYKKILTCIPDSVLLLAYYKNTLLAGGIFLFTKNYGIYYYGASSDQMRNLMAPYLIQWEAIKIAKKKNCKYFDFLGVAPPNASNNRLASVTDFKLKFGGEIIRFNPSFCIIHNVFFYHIYDEIKKIYKKFIKRG